ncbi:MAG: NACHT domain-containing protein [Bacteroides thetaiotaomicron]|nr:NACHT domain-containing protein [Bacteroides thetaiotaomicron]
MENNIALRMSGGIFFNLLLEARKKPVAKQEDCLKGLLYIFDRNVKGLSGNSLSTIASRFRNCDPALNSDYIKFGDPVTVEAFNKRLKEDPVSVTEELKTYADNYLDLETSGNWIVRSILELIEKDETIQENEKFPVIPGGVPAYKQELRKMKTVYIYNFLLGIWHFICCRKDSVENGQETYHMLSDYAGESRARKFDKSRIGFQGYEDIRISYDLELEAVKVECGGLAARYMEALGEEHTFELPKTASQVFVKANERIKKSEPKSESMTINIDYYVRSDTAKRVSRYATYLNRAEEKHSSKKTFLYETKRPFYGFFVCNDVKKHDAQVGYSVKLSKEKEKPISNICVDEFPEEKRYIILSGTGGLGKSMMMTHFMLDTIKKNGVNGKVPVFVLLRDYNPGKGDLIDCVFMEFKRHDTELHLSDLIELLAGGKAVILFDGLDEIKSENREKFYSEVELLVDNYPDSTYIIASRPTMNFRAFNRFDVYDLLPFNKMQSIEMISKLDQSVIDPEIQKDFIQDLENNRFRFSYEERTEFLGNPLFLTIMLLTYEGNHDIPTQRYLFYEQAYEAMAKKHDATKALTREFVTGLSSRDFQKYFGEFCLITYEQEKYDFTDNELTEFFQEVIDYNNLETTPEAFIKDITEKICLIYKDGTKYYFVHRSFQEYFVAYFCSKQLEQNFDAVLDMLMTRDETEHDSMVLPMLYGMDPRKTELCIFIPFLKKIFERDDEKNLYKLFLARLYPSIGFTQGDVNEFYEDESESAIYNFITETYNLKEIINGDDLPQLDMCIRDEYVDYTVEDGDIVRTRITKTQDLPFGYEEKYEEINGESMEIVGRSYEIDILDVYERDFYKEVVDMLEDDAFPLKKDFYAVIAKYEELKESYERKPSKKKFISRFH